MKVHALGHAGKLEAEKRRRSAAITRQIRLLRAHGLIRKIPRTHRYQASDRGHVALTALLAARQKDEYLTYWRRAHEKMN